MTKKTKLNSFILLMSSSCLAKLFSLLSKIALTSILGIKVMSIYGLISPLLLLIITISSFSLPNALSYLISFNRNKSHLYIKVAFICISFLSLILSFTLYIFANEIANIFFHNNQVIYPIKTLSILVPLISISSLIKGYFYGVREVTFTNSSQLLEEGSRLIFILFFLNYFLTNDSSKNASLIVISLCIGEIAQTFYLLIFSKKIYQKNFKKMLKRIPLDYISISKEMLNIAFPMTLSKLIGSFTYFLEPVILTTILVKMNYSIETITIDYGILTNYVMPLLLLPGFFSLSLSSYLLPNLSYCIKNKEYYKSKKLLKDVLSISFIIGLFFSIIFFFFGGKVLNTLYKTNLGDNQIKILSLPFIIYYIETPITTSLNAFCLTKQTFITTTISSIIRIGLLFLLIPILKINAISVSTLISCYINVLINSIILLKSFLRYKNECFINK